MTGARESPYKFLDSYGVEDRARFFGRGPEINILLADIVTARLVVLFARTGTGKTSLINAGVRPALHDRGYETFYIRVDKDPVASALAVIGADHAELSRSPESFSGALRDLAARLRRPIVLFFDQFEEFFLFVALTDPDRADEFVAEIAELYDDETSGVHIVFSMREEFFVELEALPRADPVDLPHGLEPASEAPQPGPGATGDHRAGARGGRHGRDAGGGRDRPGPVADAERRAGRAR